MIDLSSAVSTSLTLPQYHQTMKQFIDHVTSAARQNIILARLNVKTYLVRNERNGSRTQVILQDIRSLNSS
jgi:hypothetical protein